MTTTLPRIQLLLAGLFAGQSRSHQPTQDERSIASLQTGLFIAAAAFSFLFFGKGAFIIMLLYKVIFGLTMKAFRLA